jgi:RNA polymerase sigma-70 factor
VDDGDLLAERAAGPSPELAYFKLRYGSEFRDAFRASLQCTSSRDRALLRLHFIDDLSTAALAEMYGVSRWTVRRWIDETCAQILEATSKELAQRLGLPPAELTTFVRALESQIAGTLTTFLRHDK